MLRRACLAVVVAFLAGCSFISPPKRPAPATGCSPASPIADTVFGVLGFVPIVYWGSQAEPGDDFGPEFSAVVIGIPVASFGVAYLISAIYGYDKYSGCRAVRVLPAPDPAAEAQTAANERARELTNQALAAARVGQCKIVVERAVTVKQLDASLYERVFPRDAAIVRCLASTPAPAP